MRRINKNREAESTCTPWQEEPVKIIGALRLRKRLTTEGINLNRKMRKGSTGRNYKV